jgi:hypothetical protein
MDNLVLTSKKSFIDSIQRAIAERRGLAAGKLGGSEQVCLSFHLASGMSDELHKVDRAKPVFAALKYHAQRQTGIFPTSFDFLRRYSRQYASAVSQADFLGLFGYPAERELVQRLGLQAGLLKFTDTEPDRSIPHNPSLCYLPTLRGQRILLIAPFASFAAQRADKKIFESVWSRIGVPWFEPEAVRAIDIPYGFIGQVKTFERFGDSLKLKNYICGQIDSLDFDVALIAAGSLAIPLAVHIKSAGKVAISLGGHLQVLFGILGQRWLRDEFWKQNYINEHWVRMPKQFVPENSANLVDNGAYW